jgi:sugar/nucleoside kinase (ribokinase family)
LKAAFLGKVGADPFGYFLRDTLDQAGVDISRMCFGTEAPTGVAFAWVTDQQTGEAGYFSLRYLSADRTLKPAELDPAWLSRATAFQFGSLLLSAEPSAAATWRALEIVRAAGVPCIYDLNLRLPAWPGREQARVGMLAPLEVSDIVKLNRHELAFLTGETDLERGVEKIWRPHFRLLVVTLDREGCYFRTGAGAGRLAGFPVAVADTIACGDAFLAALVAQLLRLSYTKTDELDGNSIRFDYQNLELVRRACHYANAAGALTATRTGAIPALPDKRQLEGFLRNSGTTSFNY